MAALLPVVIFIAALVFPVHSYDPQPLRDFDVPGKLPGEVVAADFMSTLLTGEAPVAAGAGAGAIGLAVAQFPGLNTQGVSAAKLKLLVCGMNPPHVHPRGTELLYVLEGKVFVAFIDTNNKIFANVLEAGGVTVFPRGLIHTAVNIGSKPAQLLAFFNSQNPGTTRVAPALFKSKAADNTTFPSSILASAFGISVDKVEKLKMVVPAAFPLGSRYTGCGKYGFMGDAMPH